MSGARAAAVEASAPARVPLVRGVAVALDRRAACRVERAHGGVFVESKEALARAEAERLEELHAAAALRPFVRLLGELGLARGVRVSGHARVPAGTGLGSDVALAVAAAAALLRLVGRVAAADEVARLVGVALAGDDGAAPDALDAAASLRGGIVALARGGAPVSVGADPARIEQALLLADVGVPARGDARAGALSDDERALADELTAALAARDDAAIPTLIDRGWQATCRADPSAATAEALGVLAEARAHGGAGRPCGAGGGGLVALWLPVDRRARLQTSLQASGVRSYPARVDLLGLEVEE